MFSREELKRLKRQKFIHPLSPIEEHLSQSEDECEDEYEDEYDDDEYEKH